MSLNSEGGISDLSGYAPTRDRKCVNRMIMKKENHFELSSQRKLGILDTEFNNSNSFVTKAARANGLELGTISAEFF